MPKTDEKVMKMVEQELAKNPEVPGDELFEKAKGINGGIARMSRRQFHARYPLQVKRKQGGGTRKATARKGGRKATKAAPRRGRAGRDEGRRDAVRQVFLRFAQDVASAAESPKDLVKLVLNVDRYVDEAVRSAGK